MAEFIDIMADCFFTEYEENIAYDKAEKAITDHDKQIRADVINEVKNIIENYHAYVDDDAMVDIFSDLEYLKEQNNE